jgi:hypothetical protein
MMSEGRGVSHRQPQTAAVVGLERVVPSLEWLAKPFHVPRFDTLATVFNRERNPRAVGANAEVDGQSAGE